MAGDRRRAGGFSGLGVIVAAGDSIRIYRQRVISFAWGALLVAPPCIVVAALLALPWAYPIDLKIALPAKEMGRYFSDTFNAVPASRWRSLRVIRKPPRSSPSRRRAARICSSTQPRKDRRG